MPLACRMQGTVPQQRSRRVTDVKCKSSRKHKSQSVPLPCRMQGTVPQQRSRRVADLNLRHQEQECWEAWSRVPARFSRARTTRDSSAQATGSRCAGKYGMQRQLAIQRPWHWQRACASAWQSRNRSAASTACHWLFIHFSNTPFGLHAGTAIAIARVTTGLPRKQDAFQRRGWLGTRRCSTGKKLCAFKRALKHRPARAAPICVIYLVAGLTEGHQGHTLVLADMQSMRTWARMLKHRQASVCRNCAASRAAGPEGAPGPNAPLLVNT